MDSAKTTQPLIIEYALIILNFNDWTGVFELVKNLNISKEDLFQIYVVDNFSEQEPSKELLLYFEKYGIKTIFNKKNYGYSAGFNVGFELAIKNGCSKFIFSNTDIKVTKIMIYKMFSSLDTNDIVGPNVFDFFGNPQEKILLNRVTPLIKLELMLNSFSRGMLFKQNKDNSHILENSNMCMTVYGVSGCFFGINQRAANLVLPFDERIFLFNEEWVLAEKAFKNKLKVVVDKSIVVYHENGRVTSKNLLNRLEQYAISEKFVLEEYFPSQNWFIKQIIFRLRRLQIFFRRIIEILK